MSSYEGLDAFANVWRYHLFRNVYAPWRLGLLIDDYKHAPISSSDLSDCRLKSTRKDLRMSFVRFCATFLFCCGLQQRTARSSTNQIDVSDIHRGSRGGLVGLGLDWGPSTFGIYCQQVRSPLSWGGIGERRGVLVGRFRSTASTAVRAYPSRRVDLRNNTPCPLFRPFWSGADL